MRVIYYNDLTYGSADPFGDYVMLSACHEKRLHLISNDDSKRIQCDFFYFSPRVFYLCFLHRSAMVKNSAHGIDRASDTSSGQNEYS